MRRFMFVATLLTCAEWASPAMAESTVSTTHIDYDAGVNVTWGGGTDYLTQDASNVLFSGVGDRLTIDNSLTQSHSDARLLYGHFDFAYVGYDGHAAPGSLGAGVGGSVAAETTGNNLSQTSAESDATVNAEWDDITTLHSAHFLNGEAVLVNANLHLSGILRASPSGTIVPNRHFATWNVAVALTGIGALAAANGATGNSLTLSRSGNIATSLPEEVVDMEIPISYLTHLGAAETIGEELSVFGGASAITTRLAPGEVDSNFGAFFGNTLTWGGITSVIDPATGQPITDWTVTSASGFDYSQPYPVPEPATYALLLASLAIIGVAARRKLH